MIRHILKIIWNERRVNAWIMLEYIVIFCVLWFCCDYLYYIGKSYLEDPGFDTSHTYLIRMGKRGDVPAGENEDIAKYVTQFEERVKRFPGVESLAISDLSIPYTPVINANPYMYNADSVTIMMVFNRVTPDFFDLYRMKLQSGRTLTENDVVMGTSLVITPDRNGNVGMFGTGPFPAKDIQVFKNGSYQWDIVGVYQKTKLGFYEPFNSTVYEPLAPKDIDLAYMDISVRVKPEEEPGFAERFVANMRQQLFIGPYFLITVIPSRKIEKATIDKYITDNLNSVLAVTAFLMVNIFLALIGTFWSRTQSRRGEIGLRIAMGASKRKIRNMMFVETLIMLLITSILSTYICLNLSQTEILTSLGIPLAQRDAAGMGNGQDIINFLITFGFMALVSCLAVWYPARQSSNIAPAEALGDI